MQKIHILTIGYVHDIEKQCTLSTIIPSEIVYIIYLYNKYCDTWNKKYLSSKDIKLDEYTNQITTLTTCTNTVYGNIVLANGAYTWKLKLIKLTNKSKDINDQQPFIGFIVDKHTVLEHYKKSYGWFYDNGYIYCGGDETCGCSHATEYSKRWTYETDDGDLLFANDGDILDITLDLDKQTISLSVNGSEPIIPQSFNGLIKNDKYRLVVSLEGTDNAIQLQ
eukprot:361728_1